MRNDSAPRVIRPGRAAAEFVRPGERMACFSARFAETKGMSNHVYKMIELTGSSPNGVEHAVETAIARAAKTVRNMRWFEVTDTRGHIENGKIAHWQVTLKVGFTLDG